MLKSRIYWSTNMSLHGYNETSLLEYDTFRKEFQTARITDYLGIDVQITVHDSDFFSTET